MKKFILFALLFLGIAFAVVSTSLYLNGNIGISINSKDFDIRFTEAVLDKSDISLSAISDDGKTITFSTNDLSLVGDKSVLNFIVKNNSSLYDAKVDLNCTSNGGKNSYYSITKNIPDKIIAKTSDSGSVSIELLKASVNDFQEEFSCTLNANAVERNIKGEEYHYAFGEPTGNSTTDYKTLGKKVFVRMDSDRNYSICIDDEEIFCLKTFDYDNSINLLKEHYGTNNCHTLFGDFGCRKDNFNCTITNKGTVFCNDNINKASCRGNEDGTFTCK